MAIAETAAEVFERIADEGKRLPLRESRWVMPEDVAIEVDGFSAWRTRALAALHAYVGYGHPATAEFNIDVNEPALSAVDRGVGVLRGLAVAAKDGHLYRRLEHLITADVFGDFLEMADHLVGAQHHVAAASLIGAVLEDSLRRIADQKNVTYTRRDGIDSLNKELVKAGVYTSITQGKITGWKEISNAADHGHFKEVEAADVRAMLDGVRDFVERHLT